MSASQASLYSADKENQAKKTGRAKKTVADNRTMGFETIRQAVAYIKPSPPFALGSQ